MKKLFQYLPVILVLAIVSILVTKIVSDNKAGMSGEDLLFSNKMLGKQVPEGISIDGVAISSKYFESSEVTLINIFASWCVACQYEHKLFNEIAQNTNIKIIGVNWRDKMPEMDEWLAKHGNPYNDIIRDELGKYAISLGIRGVPETFVINNQGKIQQHVRGNITEEFKNKIIANSIK